MSIWKLGSAECKTSGFIVLGARYHEWRKWIRVQLWHKPVTVIKPRTPKTWNLLWWYFSRTNFFSRFWTWRIVRNDLIFLNCIQKHVSLIYGGVKTLWVKIPPLFSSLRQEEKARREVTHHEVSNEQILIELSLLRSKLNSVKVELKILKAEIVSSCLTHSPNIFISAPLNIHAYFVPGQACQASAKTWIGWVMGQNNALLHGLELE